MTLNERRAYNAGYKAALREKRVHVDHYWPIGIEDINQFFKILEDFRYSVERHGNLPQWSVIDGQKGDIAEIDLNYKGYELHGDEGADWEGDSIEELKKDWEDFAGDRL